MPYKDKNKAREHAKEYNKKWYQENKGKVIKKSKSGKEEIKEWYREYKDTLYCMLCGEKHPACLQFHHRNKVEKSFNIGDMARRPTSKKRIINEIKKCDVLCVNCHAKL